MDVDSPRPHVVESPREASVPLQVDSPMPAPAQSPPPSVSQPPSHTDTPTEALTASSTPAAAPSEPAQLQRPLAIVPPPRSSFTTPQPRGNDNEIDLDSPQPTPVTSTSNGTGGTSSAGPTSSANPSLDDTDAPMAASNGHDERDQHEDTSSSSSTHPASTGTQNEDDDMDRFLKRMEMEKKIAHLQQRLELASFKTNNGWSDMSINEIEHRLPSPQQQRRPQVVTTMGRGGTAYEPPSPSRAWQLADVLWQPLPQPGEQASGLPRTPQGNYRRPPHAMHAPSHSLPGGLPSFASLQPRGSYPPPQPSPRRPRVGMDDYLNRPTVSPLRGTQSGPGRHLNGVSINGQQRNGQGSGHRRSSSSVSSLPFLGSDPYPGSPLRPKKGTKKRSQSHSTLRERPTTQDVDAARALTFMLEAARSPTSTNDRLPDLPAPGQPGPRLAPLQHGNDQSPPRERAHSFAAAEPREPSEHARVTSMGPPGLRTPSSHARGRGTSMDSSASLREGFWQVHSSANGKPRPPQSTADRERELRERDRQRERERDRSERDDERPDDDQKAAELMMFLASSPSPARKRPSGDVTTSFGGTARVLFSDDSREMTTRETTSSTREREREPAPGPRPAPPSGLPAPRRLEPVARS